MSEIDSERMREDLPPSQEPQPQSEDDLGYADGMSVLQQKQKQKQNQVMEEQPQPKQDLHVQVMKRISTQSLGEKKELGTLTSEFYDDAVMSVGRIPEQAFFKVEKMVDTRLKSIVPTCDSFSENTSNKLTREERELYLDICEKATNHSKKMHEKLELAKRNENRDIS